jgi:predicted nucleic acid-binding Zn ribbon protein
MEEHDKSPAPQSECRVCKEPIRPGAQRCVHCGTFQNWRRYLTFSATVLSLLVALVSVLTVGIPVVINAVTQKRAHVEVSLLERHHWSNFMLVVSNSGEAPVLLREVQMLGVDKGKDWVYPLKHTAQGRGWPIVLEKNSYELLELRVVMRVRPDNEATEKKYGCKLQFLLYHLDGRKEVLPFSCGKFNP